MKRIIKYISLLSGTLLVIVSSSLAQDDWSWEPVAPMLLARMGHCSAAIGGKIYVFGGLVQRRQAEVTNRTEIYDPVEDLWIENTPLPVPLFQASAVTSGRFIYIIGGTVHGGGPNDDIYVFNPQTSQFSQLDRLPSPRWALGAVSIGRRVLLIGGISGRQDYHRDGYWWNIDSLGWTASPRLNHPSAGFGLAFNGAVWAVGGMSFGPMDRVEVLRDRKWELMPRARSLPEPRGELGVAFFEDTLLIAAGGIGRGGAAADVFVLATNDTLGWDRLPGLLQSRAEFSLVALQDGVYAIGGGTGGGERLNTILSSVEVLKRASSVPDNDNRSQIKPSQIVVYPNPTNNSYRIILPQSVVRIQLLDVNGRLIYDRFRLPSIRTIRESSSNLPAGQYHIVTFDAEGIRTLSGGLTVIK